MNETPFSDNTENIESREIVKKSARKAKKDEGHILQGDNYHPGKMTNVVLLMGKDHEFQGIFRFNDFTGCIEYAETPSWDATVKKGKKIDDGDEIYIKGWLADRYHFEPATNVIREALFLYSKKQRYHPVKRYLESLKWDGVNRVDTWLHDIAGTENNRYSSLVGRKMLCAMIKRIYHPGCQFDNLVVLEGKEGIYKTTMLRILGGAWYAPFSIKAESKDAVDVMSGKWILEMEELATMRGSEIEYVDAFLSRNVDRVRLSYRRNAQDFPRQCIFVGTMNPIGNNQYLRKQSANRRFWPVECHGIIQVNKLKEVRDQLFAEAMTLFEKERLFIDDDSAIKISVDKQQNRKAEDLWADIINDYLEGRNMVRAIDIFSDALMLGKDRINHTCSVRLGICMRQLGWLPKVHGKKRQKYYVRPDATLDEVAGEMNKTGWEGKPCQESTATKCTDGA